MKAAFKVTDTVLLGLNSLVVHKFRSFLTALGILFGVWSVIAMLAVNEGASYESEQHLKEMGTNNLLIESVKPSQEEQAAARERGALHYGLTHEEAVTLVTNVPNVERYALAHRTQKTAHVGVKLIPVQVIGTSPEYMELARLRLVRGRFISSTDGLRARNAVVLTNSLARRLFGYADPLDQPILRRLHDLELIAAPVPDPHNPRLGRAK